MFTVDVKQHNQAISYLEFKDWRANSVDLDDVAHYEPPHQDLRCLQIQLFPSLVLKELNSVWRSKPVDRHASFSELIFKTLKS